MSLFSRDYIKTEIEYQQCFNLLTSVQYSHSAWFLDSRKSILVYNNIVLISNKTVYNRYCNKTAWENISHAQVSV